MSDALQDRIKTCIGKRLNAAHLRLLIWLCIFILWFPFACLPAAAAVMPDVAEAFKEHFDTPVLMMVLAMVVSTLAGATALLIRIDRELTAAPERVLPRAWLMCASHMAGAWLAGVLAFIVCRQAGAGAWWTLGYVLAASFASAKFLEISVERILPPRSSQSSTERPT